MGTKACSARSTEHGRRVVRTCQVYVTLRKIQFVAVPTGNFNLLRLQQWLLCCFHARLCWSFILGIYICALADICISCISPKKDTSDISCPLATTYQDWLVFCLFFLVCSLFSHYCGTLKGFDLLCPTRRIQVVKTCQNQRLGLPARLARCQTQAVPNGSLTSEYITLPASSTLDLEWVSLWIQNNSNYSRVKD